jgi:hypothetical protein
MQNRNEESIRRLLDEIDSQYQSAQQALTGPTVGVSMHAFITARMENIGVAHEQLINLVGEDDAGRMLVDQMNRSAERKP